MVLVAFRGTDPENIKDWLTDADVRLVPAPAGHLHNGFWRAFDTVGPGILRDLNGIPDIRRKSLWLTGHSLGAALSTIAVASWTSAGLPSPAIIISALRVSAIPRSRVLTMSGGRQ
jgi:surfactin synthase thioesterase subunit